MSRPPAPPPGLLIVDKPAGMTSHDVVAKARRFLGTRKIGHAGTLDPMATGVLVLGVERATKLLGHLALDRKTYLATITLGAATTTDDAEGEILTETDASAVTDGAIAAGIVGLTGELQQVPSAVSAVKVDGKRAYARVRDGEDVDLPPRPVTVHRFDLLATRREGDRIALDVMVDCSSGTYVRALARDLGAALGVGGHLMQLRRTTVGPFTLAAARTLEAVEAEPGLSLTLAEAVAAAFPRRDVDAAETRAVRHGQRLPAAGIAGVYGVFGPDGEVLALAEDQRGAAKPVVVLLPA
ncbi:MULTISPECIES: tRNA pseudouridine(55) synthase TruB [Prauserella salsuginis group]|uniref:tRNA pseudouridine synthase B n=2 Tax=Prauserella salsuginis group TaxID=2893672 RepID=A0A839XSV7_9PSEU|nr:MULTISPECIES: tRNA pseudouridine(55) synthase TruB [Prauserella salsuginis group]MBB3665089.1 tRNA pseudouridine55 synthase [Prauserella sediminis]MCR3718559.1 tRNA pseudouridine55 synthase [Prauserella flava]MCR3733129.1 tRNA pseudouridine55 synthase [Prauserella salsuginis]